MKILINIIHNIGTCVTVTHNNIHSTLIPMFIDPHVSHERNCVIVCDYSITQRHLQYIVSKNHRRSTSVYRNKMIFLMDINIYIYISPGVASFRIIYILYNYEWAKRCERFFYYDNYDTIYTEKFVLYICCVDIIKQNCR